MRIALRRTVLLLLLPCALPAQCIDMAPAGLNGCGFFTPFGIPVLRCDNAPMHGNSGFVLSSTAPCNVSIGVLVAGLCPPGSVVVRGPFGAGGFCGPSMATCALFVDTAASAMIPGTLAQGLFTFPVPIPADPRLVGARFCGQAFELCAHSPGAVCIAASQGVAVTVQ